MSRRIGDEDLVDVLIDEGASLKGNRLLFQAIASWRGNDRMFRSLIEKGAEIECRNTRRETPLLYACRNWRFDAAKLLLDAETNVQVADKDGRTPLHFAAQHRHANMVGELIRAGASPQAEDSRGKTAYDVAVDVSADFPQKLMEQLRPTAK